MIAQAQEHDLDLQKRKGNPEFTIAPDGVILFKGRISVPRAVFLFIPVPP
jgi:hypothetical protein